MKIQTPAPGYPAATTGVSPQPKGLRKEASETGGSESAESPFTVTLSREAALAAGSADAEEAARRERVAAIRAQLASGSYNISGKDVADKILKVMGG